LKLYKHTFSNTRYLKLGNTSLI